MAHPDTRDNQRAIAAGFCYGGVLCLYESTALFFHVCIFLVFFVVPVAGLNNLKKTIKGEIAPLDISRQTLKTLYIPVWTRLVLWSVCAFVAFIILKLLSNRIEAQG